jgi:hypothetical protein
MSAILERKPRRRIITGWRQVVPLPRGPKWKKPVAPVPREKTDKT